MYLNWTENKPDNAWPCCFIGGWAQEQSADQNDDLLNNLHKKTPQEVFDSETYEKLRHDALNNKRNPLCSVCWDLEDIFLLVVKMMTFLTEVA